MIRRSLVPALVLFMLSQVAQAAQPTFDEYGRPAEMRGLTKVYVDVGDDIELREHVIKTIDKAASPTRIEWVAKIADAQMILAYTFWQEREGDDTFAKMLAFIATPEGKSRLLWTAKDRKMSIAVFTPTTSTILAKKFAAAYRDAQR